MRAGVAQRARRGQNQGSWPKVAKEYCIACGVMLSNKAGVEKEGGEDTGNDDICLPLGSSVLIP